MIRMKKTLNYITVKHFAAAFFLVAALLQGKLRQYVAGGLLLIICIYSLIAYFVNHKGEKQKRSKGFLKSQQPKQTTLSSAPAAAAPPVNHQPRVAQSSFPVNAQVTMLRHINFRITEKLHRAGYSEATWSWCCNAPLDVVMKNGTARIRTFETGDKNYADVSFLPNGHVKISMMQIEELDQPQPDDATNTNKDSSILDLSNWYELTASQKIRDMIDEIAARGNRKLFLNENGELFIVQNGQKKVLSKLGFMPEKSRWKELTPLFADDDIVAAVGNEALTLTWNS